ncbi:MAG: glycoside hydrolase family 127 protein [Tannerellaceae bacterium]|jgi:DUF1680 family protein|nr:glycoside hydrolase family 127 protein [Tannerellaceae bacterium]
MKRKYPNNPAAAFIILLIALAAAPSCSERSLMRMDAVDFSQVSVNDEFWSPRLDRHASTTLAVCIDQIENQTGRIRNFELAALGQGQHSGIFFDDSDVYKALEGIACSLINHPDQALEQKADEWIDKIAAAQQPDGYINTYYALTGLEQRWTNMDKHEMYCAGHMIEAAVAYHQATGKRKLLDASARMADHIMNTFGPGKRHWVPGHEEIELALVKLSRATRQPKYLDMAAWLLDERGHGHGTTGGEGKWDPAYYQDDRPVREMTDIAGHAVRCMYLYCGMADVAAQKRDSGYIAALDRLWDDVALRNMYVTGGIGSSRHNEGFTSDYDLPNREAYCETCASVGMVYWNARMNRLTGNAKYVDILERSMYNGALAGISLKGDRFFYVNPLESDGRHHRQEWYGCACCPSQMSRFLPSVGGYVYGTSRQAIWVHLYMGNTATINVDGRPVRLRQSTRYPWNGAVELEILSTPPAVAREIRLRIPSWCNAWTIEVNGSQVSPEVDKGYAVISRAWQAGDRISLAMDMPVETVEADPRVTANLGKRAVQRGPLVYCAEEVDNPGRYDSLTISSATKFDLAVADSALNGATIVRALSGSGEASLVPYYAWDNRQAGRMKVWIDYRGDE